MRKQKYINTALYKHFIFLSHCDKEFLIKIPIKVNNLNDIAKNGSRKINLFK